MNFLGTVALIATNIAALVGIAVALYKFISKWDKWSVEKDAHDNEHYLSILRLTIMSENMPLSERIKAGDKYIKLGGNGAVSFYYNEILLPKWRKQSKKEEESRTKKNKENNDEET